MYIDTHAHLYSDAFNEDRNEMIQRALDAGVERLLLPNIDSQSIAGMHELEQKYPGVCLPMMGLHPCSVKEDWEQELALIEEKLFTGKYVAVGEIGIDLYWEQQYLPQQQEVFSRQIEWAKKLALPIVIHARSSFAEIFEVMDKHYDERLTGVFHCFTGNEQDLQKIRTYNGFYIGIGGVLTFKKSGLDEVLRHASLSEIVLETDAPYLAPTPYRGKRNESAYIPLIAEKLSDLFEVSVQEVAEITSENAKKCFNLS